MVNVCLIGAGRMGMTHARHIAYTPGANLYAVVDPHLKEPLFDAKILPSVQSALTDPKVDAVVIVTPTDTHAELIEMAARASKPIFCEKPIDLSLARVDECLATVKACKVPLLLGFNRRFDPSVAELQLKLSQGVVGPIEQISITSRDYVLPEKKFLKTSGGFFFDFSIHDFDMALWLLQEEVEEVYATGSALVDPSLHEINDIDTAMITLSTKSGKLVQISNSRRCVFGYDQRIEVSGPKGMIALENQHPTSIKTLNSQGIHSPCLHPNFPERYEKAYEAEMHHFLTEVVPGKKAPLVDGQAARAAQVLSIAALHSHKTKSPVSLSGFALDETKLVGKARAL